MSQLTNNTTALQAILEAINALPEAGGGGLKMASGTVTNSSLNKVEVTGLDFAAKFLAVGFYSSSSSGVAAFAHIDGVGYGANSSASYTATLAVQDGTATITCSAISSRNKTFSWYAFGE